MRKRTYSIMTAALLMTGALLTTACSTDEEAAIDNAMPGSGSSETIQFTATLAPKGGASRDQSGTRSGSGEAQPALGEAKDGDAQTRAITTGKDANDKEILNVTWAQGEEIAIYYETTDGHASTTATVESVDETTGVATITATLTDAENGADAKFVYPASLANKTGDIDEVKLLSQNGNLTGANGISTKFDAATGTAPIIVRGSEASVSGTISLANQVCICKFKFYLDDSQGSGPSSGVSGGNERTFSPVIIRDGNVIYMSSAESTTNIVTIPDGTSVTIENVKIRAISVAGIICSGNATINLEGANTVTTSAGGQPAIQVGPSDKSLTIQGSGSLIATGGSGGAGIGCGSGGTCGNITISGGTVTAKSGGNGAGIGSGELGTCGTITINGGSVAATGGNTAAGIGSGGGSVSASGSGSYATCGTITINGGIVLASGGSSAAGIGSGYHSTCGSITISGGTVTANGGRESAGIGSGVSGNFASINITKDITSVTAIVRSLLAKPIGNGKDDAGSGTVTIDGTTEFTFTTSTVQFEHFNSTRSTTYDENDTWTLTKK